MTEADYDFEAPHHGLALSGDEQTLCAAGRASDYVALVSAATLAPVAILEVDDAPGWAATGPDGRHCFVPNTRADTLSVVSYAERREVARLRVGNGPKQIEAARLPLGVVDPPPLRLTRRCVGGGRLRVRLTGGGGVRGINFKLGRRLVAGAAATEHVIVRRTLARTRARQLRAVVETAVGRKIVARSLPRCGLRRTAR